MKLGIGRLRNTITAASSIDRQASASSDDDRRCRNGR
jgi:hypothetical protein